MTEEITTEPDLSPSERMNDLLLRAATYKEKIEESEQVVKTAKKKLAEIVKTEIPTLLSEMQTDVWAHDGISTKLVTKFSGSLSRAPDEEKAVDHLRENGFIGALKTVLAVEFSEDEREKAELLAGGISSSYAREVSYQRTINASTLKSWVSGRLKDGVAIDLDVLGLSTWREANINIEKD